MSGTSMDGVDLASVRFEHSGIRTNWELEQFQTVAYPKALEEQIRAVAFQRGCDHS